jgi:hypothetical protein
MGRRVDFISRVLANGEQLVCEFLGPFPVYVGITAVVWHLAGVAAVIVGYSVLVGALLLSGIVGMFFTEPPAPAAEAGPAKEALAQHDEQRGESGSESSA